MGKSKLEETVEMLNMGNEQIRRMLIEIHRKVHSPDKKNYEEIVDETKTLNTAITMNPNIEHKEIYQIHLKKLLIETAKENAKKYDLLGRLNILSELEYSVRSTLESKSKEIKSVSYLRRWGELYNSIIEEELKIIHLEGRTVRNVIEKAPYTKIVNRAAALLGKLPLSHKEKKLLERQIYRIRSDALLDKSYLPNEEKKLLERQVYKIAESFTVGLKGSTGYREALGRATKK